MLDELAWWPWVDPPEPFSPTKEGDALGEGEPVAQDLLDRGDRPRPLTRGQLGAVGPVHAHHGWLVEVHAVTLRRAVVRSG